MGMAEKLKSRKTPLNRSITLGCVLFIVFLCILLCYANLSIYKKYVYDDYKDYISDILNYTMSHIDGDDLEECIKTGEESEKYKETLLFMDDLMNHIGDIHYFYAILPLNRNKTGNVMSVLSAERYHDRYEDTEGNLYLGWVSDDEFDHETVEKFFNVMKNRGITYFEEKTEWGTDFTGAMPIRNSSGNSIAVLAVDIDISFIDGMIRQYAYVNILIVSCAGILFIILFLFWSRKNITRPIQELEASASGFVDKSHGQRNVEELHFEAPEVISNNEIRALSDAVVKMTEDMKDYVTDIVKAEHKAEHLQKLASRDALTGVRNKAAYDRELRDVEEAINAGETKVGLAIIDLNLLKSINDTYGHDKGNITIIKLCNMICTVFKHSPVFRIGGDEFAVILRGQDYDDYYLLDKELMQKMKETYSAGLEPWERFSAAIGAAFYDESIDDDMDSLFRRADHIMYDKKREMKK